MRIIGFAALLSFVLVGCQTTEPVQKKTSLEIQAVQAKVFEHDKALVFKAVLSVLQDVGHVVQRSRPKHTPERIPRKGLPTESPESPPRRDPERVPRNVTRKVTPPRHRKVLFLRPQPT